MRPNATRSTLSRLVIAAGCALALGVGFGTSVDFSSRAFAQASDAGDSTKDVLILKNGMKLEGTIVSETATTIKFKGLIGGIPLEQEYKKSDILEIRRATKKPDAAATPAVSDDSGDLSAGTASSSDAKTPATPADPDAPRVYIIPLSGTFGEDISQTPLQKAMEDATAQNATIIVLSLNAKAVINPRNGEPLDEQMAWNLTSRVEQIFPVVTEVMPKEWKEKGITPPRVVLLCKRAIGAAAFFPLAFKEVYFSSDGLMGGVGNLSEIFGQTGDDVVREKQRSLRLGHIQGWANYGGYNIDLVRAMSRREFVWTMKLEGGKAVFFERMPEDPSEELLTDDGEGPNQDNMVDYVEGTGNDVLTLNARLARLVGLSKGTVDTEEDLIVNLAAGRNAVVIKDRGAKIMKQWSRGLDTAQRQIMKLLEEYRDLRMDQPANYDNRTKFRGARKQKLLQVKNLLNRWEEALDLWSQLNGMPNVPRLESLIKEIELQQLADKPDPK